MAVHDGGVCDGRSQQFTAGDIPSAVLEHMAHGVAVYDRDHRLTAFNRQFIEIFDFPPDFLQPGMAFEEILRYRAERGDFGAGDREAQVQYRVDRRSNTGPRVSGIRTLPNGTAFIRNRRPLPGGGTFVTYTDVTAQHKAERELAEKTTFLETIFESMAQGVALYGEDGRLLSWNRRYVEILNLPDGFLYEGIAENDIRRYRARRGDYGTGDSEALIQKRAAEAGHVREQLSERVLPNGTSYIHHQKPMPGGGWLATHTDITEQKRAEAAIQESAKMEALGKLTGGVAHEFNNLLQVVAGNLDLLKMEVTGQAGLEARVERMLRAAYDGKELTHCLLSYTGKQVVAPKAVDPARFVKETVSLLRPVLGEGIAVESAVVGRPWSVLADLGQLQAAILNIAVNARDALPGGGTVTIGADNVTLEGELVVGPSQVLPAGDYVRISVWDDGTGMSEDVKARVFDPFYTTKEVGAGTGLGLSMVFGFVTRQCGGAVAIDSEIGKGTTVRLYLPRAEED